MKATQYLYKEAQWQPKLEVNEKVTLLLAFGCAEHIKQAGFIEQLESIFPNAELIGCTTAGEICKDELYDNSIVLTALEFSATQIQVSLSELDHHRLDFSAQNAAQSLYQPDLKYVLVLADGHKINGSELLRGLERILPNDIIITGGLAGDGTEFKQTQVFHNRKCISNGLLLCGFYGDAIRAHHGSQGGWEAFGPDRLVTYSERNILYSLDDKSALSLYKKYLGEHAKELPSSALLFPLLIKSQAQTYIRTILDVDEKAGSMIFAGDIPQGSTAQLMRASFDRLINGAELAAKAAQLNLPEDAQSGLILMVSCVGRRLVLKLRVEEELEAVTKLFGDNWTYAGFYSYGEISPLIDGKACALHNQTMTLTALYEVL
ncbi:FIST signal transduction protein [Catenovulum sediminis]|uniref:FIST N-terminal domain-containing protein n=1 Tax=Catenovulum sediminis TaxID=1740262 RepID=A0ABV1RE12_9ALTE|nr:FIST N-terminal domain-containing protein [Catenovulum sediminis]